MNHYAHHIGDYAEATAHLTFVEDAAYTRLIRKYMATEAALPADLKTVQRLVIARTKEERQAVDDMLREFFTLEADGWHQTRCDEELAIYREKAERNRTVGKLGGRPKKTPEKTQTVTESKPTVNPDGLNPEPTGNPSHKPVANSQEPETKKHADSDSPGFPVRPPAPQPADDARSIWAGECCKALREHGGVNGVNPSHPDLLAMFGQGLTPKNFADLAGGIKFTKGVKPFAYHLAAMKGQIADASAPGPFQPDAKVKPDEPRPTVEPA